MPKIVFRADAEKSIGIGDLKSLFYIAEEFRKNSWEPFFIIKDYELALKIMNKSDLDNVIIIPCNISLDKEISFIKNFCVDNAIDCLFMEITKRSLRDYESLGKPTPIKACVNFDGVITDDFDLVVNWCIDSSDLLYEDCRGRKTTFILGFENIVLPSCLDWAEISKRVYSKDVKKILISMGGVDEFNMTAKIIKVLSQQEKKYDLRVILGPGYENPMALSEFIKAHFKNFIIKKNINNLSDDYLWADIAFSAGGLTSSELIATKTPAIIIATYKHQVKRCKYYSANKLVCYVGFHNVLNERNIIKSLNYLLDHIDLYRNNLSSLNFKGGNEKIFKIIDSYR